MEIEEEEDSAVAEAAVAEATAVGAAAVSAVPSNQSQLRSGKSTTLLSQTPAGEEKALQRSTASLSLSLEQSKAKAQG